MGRLEGAAETVSHAIGIIQDQRSLMSALLTIQEALETGVMPKSFLMFNDGWISEVMSRIVLILHDKYHIEVPGSEI